MSAVWCADGIFLDQLVYLSESNLVFDSPSEDKAEEFKKAPLGGTPVAKVLSSNSVDVSPLSVL